MTLGERVRGLFEQLHVPVFRYLLRKTQDSGRAEEITQETFLRLFRHLRENRLLDNPKAWVFTVANNLAIDASRDESHIKDLDETSWRTLKNRGPPAAIHSRKFRLDLFYRLNVFPIHVPPLRERPEDILLLARYFIERYAAKEGKRIRRVEKRTAELLEGYHWPGNIRELQNVIERAMIFCDSDSFFVERAWLQPETEPPVDLQPSLINQERQLIEAALAESRGRISGPDGAAIT